MQARGQARVMSILDLSLRQFNDQLAARQPTPAGGSAAALTGSHAAALVSLVIRYTLGKAAFSDITPELEDYLTQSETLRLNLAMAADEDIAAFDGVIAAYAMPKDNPTARTARTAAIQAGMKNATATPFATAELCLTVMELIGRVMARVNPAVAGDGAAALYLANGALRTSLLNVRTNLHAVTDQDFAARWSANTDRLEQRTAAAYTRAQLACEAALSLDL